MGGSRVVTTLATVTSYTRQIDGEMEGRGRKG